VGHVVRMGKGRGVYRFLVERPEWKRPLWRPRHRWEDNIKVGLRERQTGFGWLGIGSSRRLLWTLYWTFGFHKESRIFLTSWVTTGFSNNILHHGVSK
jgi:hypothetical protein